MKSASGAVSTSIICINLDQDYMMPYASKDKKKAHPSETEPSKMQTAKSPPCG